MARTIVWGAMATAVLAASSAYADSVKLLNGDVINGKVVSVDDQQAVISSEALGEVTIDRSKLKSISFGDEPAPETAATTPEKLLEDLTGREMPQSNTPGLNLDGLLQGGDLQLGDLQQLQKALPLLAEPEVQKQFQSYLQGLMTGELTIDDIRSDAADARDELKKLQDELGPRGKAFDSYLNILDGFLNEAEPSASVK